jgi:hypothetical protein
MEIWRAVVGHEGRYEISDLGRVRSLLQRQPRILAQSAKRHRRGCLSVELRADGSKRVHRLVHQLVLEAFVGPRPEGHGGAHDDGDPTNNRLPNLAWKTQLENMEDRDRHGRTAVGEQAGGAKLTVDEVLAIRGSKAGVASLARTYGVGPTAIRNILDRETWTHV